MKKITIRCTVCVALFLLIMIQTLHSQGVPCKFPVSSGSQTFYLDCFSSHDITKTQPNLDRLVIVHHGAAINGDVYFNGMVTAAGRARNTTSLIFAPQVYESNSGLPSSTLYWPGGWRYGDNSRNGPRISNFALLDSVIERITTLNSQIKKVVVVGHSAGGMVVSRYSGGTPITESIKTRKGVHIRYIISNPSAYLYFNNERWISGSRYQFRVPNSGNCSSYDRYPYGIGSNLNTYMSTAGATKIREQFGKRNIQVLLGTADSLSSQLDVSCGANLQGSYRFERGTVFYAYLGHLYGQQVYDNHKIGWAVGTGHDGQAMWRSDCGLFFIYDYGVCRDPNPVGVASRKTAEASLFARQSGDGIHYRVPSSGNYQLSIYSLNGRLISENLYSATAGESSFLSLEQLGLSPGRYTARLVLR